LMPFSALSLCWPSSPLTLSMIDMWSSIYV
jgi:hypothetical protein